MSEFLVALYHFFRRHRVLLYGILLTWLVVAGFLALRLRFEEDLVSLFPDSAETERAKQAFEKLNLKDKVIVLVSAHSADEADLLVEATDTLAEHLQSQLPEHIKSMFYEVNAEMMNDFTAMVDAELPLFLKEEDYGWLVNNCNADSLRKIMQNNYTMLLSPSGQMLGKFILQNPLGLNLRAMNLMQNMQGEAEKYIIIQNHIFTQDEKTTLLILSPTYGLGNTGENEQMVRVIEDELSNIKDKYPTLELAYYGGPAVAVYNANQIKADTIVTASVALLIIVVFMFSVFHRKRSVLLIVVPVVFGVLFSLACMYLLQGKMSAIAIGAGTVVVGIAMSYSIHLLAHQSQVHTVEQLIRDLAYPLIVGGFTTIGAFFGLVFTSSHLLRDLGWFASLTLVGTTLFSVVFLPHFLKAEADEKQGIVFCWIEKFNAYSFEKNKWLVGGILLLFVVSLFTYNRVGFCNNMLNMSYMPAKFKTTEEKLFSLMQSADEETEVFLVMNKDAHRAMESYALMQQKLDSLQAKGQIISHSSADGLFLSEVEKQRRIARWNDFWTPERQQLVRQVITDEANRYQMNAQLFEPFFLSLTSRGTTTETYNRFKEKYLSEWVVSADSLTVLVNQVTFAPQAKHELYAYIEMLPDALIFDQGYFTEKWITEVNDNFYLVLYISSCLIFVVLLLSYRRLELTLLTFLPMFFGWVIIIGIMGMLNIQFNIVTIIISTFIFGMGDDFSIFVMDGLQEKYRTGNDVINSHKTAIFFSSFTTIVGIGALLFAKHPALHSLSVLAVIGMFVVVLVSYTIMPIAFRVLVLNPVQRGLLPYTIGGVLRTVWFGVLVVLFLPVALFSKPKACRGVLGGLTGIDVKTNDLQLAGTVYANSTSLLARIALGSLGVNKVRLASLHVPSDAVVVAIVGDEKLQHQPLLLLKGDIYCAKCTATQLAQVQAELSAKFNASQNPYFSYVEKVKSYYL